MNVSQINRLNTAVEFLKNKDSFKVENFVLTPISNKKILVNFFTNYTFFESITKAIALKELNEMKEYFYSLVHEVHKFLDYIKGKELEFILKFDYGGGAILICREKNGTIEFAEDVRE